MLRFYWNHFHWLLFHACCISYDDLEVSQSQAEAENIIHQEAVSNVCFSNTQRLFASLSIKGGQLFSKFVYRNTSDQNILSHISINI